MSSRKWRQGQDEALRMHNKIRTRRTSQNPAGSLSTNPSPTKSLRARAKRARRAPPAPQLQHAAESSGPGGVDECSGYSLSVNR